MAERSMSKLSSEPLLEVTDLAKHFDVSKPWLARKIEGAQKQILKAVDGLEFKINQGQTFSLVGESGCGKSTVAKLVVGLHKPSRGVIKFEGRNVADAHSRADSAALRRRWQMIFQDPYASLNPRWRVRDIIAEPIRVFGLVKSRDEQIDKVGALLTQVGLSPVDGEKYPHEFSGGQRQRISIARALSSNPEFLVCDEPTSALDVSVQAQILNLMKDLQKEFGLTYLFISHNLAVVYHLSDKIGVMYLGRLCEVAAAKDLFTRPQHPYTRLLLETIPDLEMTGRERVPVAGEVPNPINPPPGCAFHPRCPFANDRCRSEAPTPTERSGHIVACHAAEEGRLPDATFQAPKQPVAS